MSKVIHSDRGMNPDELMKFVEKMARQGVDPSTLNKNMLENMIAGLKDDDTDLANYFSIRTATMLMCRSGDEQVKAWNKKIMGDIRECWPSLDRAKVIASQSALNDILQHSEDYLKKTLNHAPDHTAPLLEQELHDLAEKTVKYPDHIPFDHTYFSFGKGIESYDHAHQVADILLGILVSKDYAWTFFSNLEGSYVPVCVYHINHWTACCSKAPWCIVQLVDLVNSYKSYIEEVPRTLKRRMQYQKMTGIKNAIPPPFYRVALKDIHIKKRAQTLFPTGRRLGHRHDRRGHERCKFQRGKLPLDPKIEARLVKRGYEIFKSNPVDVHTYRKLSIRGLPYKAHDEWLAVKTKWVDSCVVGDESLPYVPSIHEIPGKDS